MVSKMKYIKENKLLLLKYLFIIIINFLVYIFINFYFNSSMYKEIYMLFCVIVLDTIIYYYKEKTKFIWYFDYIVNLVVGFILLCFFKDIINYGTVLFSIILSNNIVFMRSRLSDKFLKKTFQYFFMFFSSILSLFISLCIFNLI